MVGLILLVVLLALLFGGLGVAVSPFSSCFLWQSSSSRPQDATVTIAGDLALSLVARPRRRDIGCRGLLYSR